MIDIRSYTIKNLLQTSAICFVFAIALNSLAVHQAKKYDWTPLAIPVDLTKGKQFSGMFTAPINVSYDISIATEKRWALDIQECHLGIKQCSEAPSQLSLSWTIEGLDKIVASGNSKDKWIGSRVGAGEIERVLGEFKAGKDKTYTVRIAVESSSPLLQSASPRLMVRMDHFEQGDVFVMSFLLGLGAYLAGLIGIILLLIAGTKRLFAQKHNHSSPPIQ